MHEYAGVTYSPTTYFDSDLIDQFLSQSARVNELEESIHVAESPKTPKFTAFSAETASAFAAEQLKDSVNEYGKLTQQSVPLLFYLNSVEESYQHTGLANQIKPMIRWLDGLGSASRFSERPKTIYNA